MFGTRKALTFITPIPSFIPRQLALDILHSHSEVITLNPLVLDHKPIPAPRDAPSDEFYSTWYEMTDKIQVVPGVGSMGASKLTLTGCFQNMPWGVQMHIYAPLKVDFRCRYEVAGNEAGIEPAEQRDMELESLGVPEDGLYLRVDIEVKCNVAMAGFVRSQIEASSRKMVERIMKKAELLDAGILQAMMQDGRLKTFNPNDLSQPATNRTSAVPYIPSPVGSPRPGSRAQQLHVGPCQIPVSPESPTMGNYDIVYQAHAHHGLERGKEAVSLAELPDDSQHYQHYHSQVRSFSGQSQVSTLDYWRPTSSSDPAWSPDQLRPSWAGTKRSSLSSTGSDIPHVSVLLASELPTDTETKS
ncbi:hypothetical protein E4U42_003389 [Claviceps africana]|uniref:DUF7053 domain-containing protein n=1 Tax=Claviceps africana TaxID=83212 RepID=A0A8K0J9L4_9HYPO|nr:hypothetical protein E4U42_003389 [Claviceps africana]